uniref:Fimbrillin family protein n=1 Tax=Prevotella sp. GTC17260 TaxID=3236796 RepID=A0AB33J9G9_9BACT
MTANNTENNPLQLDVELIRCLAKVDIDMHYKDNMSALEKEATKGLKITHIIFKNLPTTYSLFPPKATYDGTLKADEDYTNGITSAKYSDEGVNPVLRKSVYVPEYLRSTGAAEATKSTIEVHYAKHGIERKQAEVEIDHHDWNRTDDIYTPAITAALSTKSIVRNTSYSLSGTLEGWVQESITFNWEILPWTLVKSDKEFAAVIVNPNIDANQPNLNIQGDGGKELLWHSGGADGLKLKFNIEAPVGGVWRFTITNHNDFDLTGKMVNTGTAAISGIAGSGEVELTITPLKPWAGNIRTTELYLTINGVEVQIVPDLITRGVEPGPTNRFLIKQSN